MIKDNRSYFDALMDPKHIVLKKIFEDKYVDYKIGDIFRKATTFQLKFYKCKRCGDICVRDNSWFIRHKRKQKQKYPGMCRKCCNVLKGKLRRNKHQKELKTKITNEELDYFFINIYPYIMDQLNNMGKNNQQWQDAFHKYLLNIAVAIKNNGLLNKDKIIRAIKMAKAYLYKATKGKVKELTFSDLMIRYKKQFGLGEYFTDIDEV